MKSKLKIISCLLLFSFILSAKAQKDINGIWWTPNMDAKIKMYTAKDGLTYGKINWLKEPNETDGSPKCDTKNPDVSKRTNPIQGLLIFKHFKKEGENKWINGEVYDAESGKTYSCQMTLISENVLEVRGYIGLPMLGRTETFKRVIGE